MSYTHQAQIPLHNLSGKGKYAEIFPTLLSSLISIGKLCDNECIVTFDKHIVIVRKNKADIIEGYQDLMYGLWCFPIHDPYRDNQQSNMLADITSKHWFQHIKPMELRHTVAYRPTPPKDLAIFYHEILCCTTKRTLIQSINDGSFTTWPVITVKLIKRYLSDS